MPDKSTSPIRTMDIHLDFDFFTKGNKKVPSLALAALSSILDILAEEVDFPPVERDRLYLAAARLAILVPPPGKRRVGVTLRVNAIHVRSAILPGGEP